MLGDFVNRGLVMLFGYAFPAFECYKTMERNRVDIDQLRFWCQYWVIVALLTVSERIADYLISWLPLYGELKVALLIYLWYPKTKGTSVVYEGFFRPYIAKYEIDIDRKFPELRARAWNLATFHLQNSINNGPTTVYEFLQYVVNQIPNAKGSSSRVDKQPSNSITPPRATGSIREKPQSSKKWPWSPSAPPISMMKRLENQAPKSHIVQEQLPCEIPLVATMVDTDTTISASDNRTDPPVTEEARIRRRRF
ncbi:hypothetical protein NE237_003028 [Protea cynaroides]|uniref:HVA22-like protein n=1 Tax=Protea cynaroides TaxID=273540 RepID=A0A9Q0QSC7_9MAGN|nr:hypothetical protein NE237_003028 [Protea cynaroides]